MRFIFLIIFLSSAIVQAYTAEQIEVFAKNPPLPQYLQNDPSCVAHSSNNKLPSTSILAALDYPLASGASVDTELIWRAGTWYSQSLASATLTAGENNGNKTLSIIPKQSNSIDCKQSPELSLTKEIRIHGTSADGRHQIRARSLLDSYGSIQGTNVSILELKSGLYTETSSLDLPYVSIDPRAVISRNGTYFLLRESKSDFRILLQQDKASGTPKLTLKYSLDTLPGIDLFPVLKITDNEKYSIISSEISNPDTLQISRVDNETQDIKTVSTCFGSIYTSPNGKYVKCVYFHEVNGLLTSTHSIIDFDTGLSIPAPADFIEWVDDDRYLSMILRTGSFSKIMTLHSVTKGRVGSLRISEKELAVGVPSSTCSLPFYNISYVGRLDNGDLVYTNQKHCQGISDPRGYHSKIFVLDSAKSFAAGTPIVSYASSFIEGFMNEVLVIPGDRVFVRLDSGKSLLFKLTK